MTKPPLTLDRDTAKRIVKYLESLERLAVMSPMAKTVAGLDGEKIEVLGNDIHRIKQQL